MKFCLLRDPRARALAACRRLLTPSTGMLVRQLPEDWKVPHGIRPLLLESLIHPDHVGTCCKAAGWEHVGETAGRRDGDAVAIERVPREPSASSGTRR